ncbi:MULTISPECIES: ATP-dependent nuclease [Desulfovibrio]|uniref:Predicted ATP-dependent endonuclease of the OLD family, contains P-loop ATPase and TOPRIM domains n=1 Tax=Desulfovibrio desulfuricans TaxID=876 RepID=A0AA94L335_DESDE|nr:MULTISPECIES: ATP-binding protein [Desulfovibrio]ATD82431.1 ATP-dependent endonuclease [Desulfovibrio sp. G11]SFW66144.1 Predicted ATP-dependent endonuclease of the OLD family, contains P-loop ATPase and TOPRIM domains [Desulfovibrio desulfuricans]SPD35220.1 P-loop containing nucleoside triphosphate hydrolase [Desulfovibrio sp. G11]
MARIRKIEISNFRGIQKLEWRPSPGINCLIGAGDSGKSTVLDAIDLCLGARRNIQLSDADFFGLDITNPISITLTLGALDDSMIALESFGAFLRGYHAATGVVEDEPCIGAEVVLCLNLTVTGDLEPSWTLISNRASQQGLVKTLAWKDRLAMAPTRIGAPTDYNLSWQRGSVLNRISEERADASAALVKAARDARGTFGDQAEQQLSEALGVVAATAQELGVPIGAKARALLDSHSVSFGGGTISLHNEDGIPLRSLGIGSSRLLVAGLQRKAASQTSVVLSDELEYGLEPHRIGRFLGSLGAKEDAPLQAFLTTHSPTALRELSGSQLFVLRRQGHEHTVRMVGTDNDIQSTIRLYPEAFLANSVIVCEGASEIGLLRGLDLHRVEQGIVSLSAQGIAIVDGGGGDPNRLYSRAAAFQSLGYRVMVVRDNDKIPTPAIEKKFQLAGGVVIACRAGRALEDELFGSLTPGACQRLINYACELHGNLVHEHLRTVSMNTLTVQIIYDEIQNAQAISVKNRDLLGQAARIRNAGWFKSISWMEDVAKTIVAPDLPLCDPEFCALVDQIFLWAAHGTR